MIGAPVRDRGLDRSAQRTQVVGQVARGQRGLDRHHPDLSVRRQCAMLGLALTTVVSAVLWGHPAKTLGGTFVVDNYAVYFDLLFCAAGILTPDDKVHTSEIAFDPFKQVLATADGLMAPDLNVPFSMLQSDRTEILRQKSHFAYWTNE